MMQRMGSHDAMTHVRIVLFWKISESIAMRAQFDLLLVPTNLYVGLCSANLFNLDLSETAHVTDLDKSMLNGLVSQKISIPRSYCRIVN